MKTFSKIHSEIYESLKRSVKWEWTDFDEEYEEYFAEFSTENEDYFVTFEKEFINSSANDYIVRFDSREGGEEAYSKTGKFEANVVLATVIEIIKDFVQTKDPDSIVFSAENDEINRGSVYRKIISREIPQEYRVDISQEMEETIFRIYKNK